MIFDEVSVNARRRQVYVDRIVSAIERVGVIDGRDALGLAKDLVSSFDFALRHHLAEWSRVEIRAYLGVGTQDWVRVSGRIAERSNVALPVPDEETFDILVSCWYRFLVAHQPVTPVLAKRGDREVLSATDDEGFFDITLSTQPQLGEPDHSVELEVGGEATYRADREVGYALIPHADAQVCVLVDLDGLILGRPQNRFAQVLAELILGTRQRLETKTYDLERFLRHLQRGNGVENPVFYLSHAPRHLHSHVDAARRYADLPTGYLHLRDFDLGLRRVEADGGELGMLLAQDLIDKFSNHDFVFVGAADRAEYYEPTFKALRHRLSSVYLLGDTGTPQSLLDLNEDLQLSILTANGERLLMDAIQQGWST